MEVPLASENDPDSNDSAGAPAVTVWYASSPPFAPPWQSVLIIPGAVDSDRLSWMPPAHTGIGNARRVASAVDRIIMDAVAKLLADCGIVNPPAFWYDPGGTSRINPTLRLPFVRQLSRSLMAFCRPTPAESAAYLVSAAVEHGDWGGVDGLHDPDDPPYVPPPNVSVYAGAVNSNPGDPI